MSTKGRSAARRLTGALILVGLTGICAWAAMSALDCASGNYTITVYGRVVDAEGNGIAGVTIRAQLTSSGGPTVPIMMGRPEQLRFVEAVTRDDGTFEIGPMSGYGISLRQFTWQGSELRQMGPAPSSDVSWSLQDPRDRARLPGTASTRITYHMRPYHR
jgi:hypothetical protein